GMYNGQADLSELDPLTIVELQRWLSMSSPTLTGAIDRMESQKLVRRVRSPDDRRAIYVEPADHPAMRRNIMKIIDATEHRCFGALSTPERRDLLRLLAKAAGGLEGATISS